MNDIPHISNPPTLAEVDAYEVWWREETAQAHVRPKRGRSILGITRSEMEAFLAGKSNVIVEWRINMALLITLIVGGTVACVNISNKLNNVTTQVTNQATTQGAYGAVLTALSADIVVMKARLTTSEKEIDRLRSLLDK